MSRWFRHYAGMMRDEKLVRVALQCKQPVERVLWVWGAILESAAEINDGGKYDLDIAEAAYFLRADEADIKRIVECLIQLGRLSSDGVAKWRDRQFQSDISTDRVRRHRGRQDQGSDGTGNGQSDGCNGDVTPVKRSGNAPETETNTESETKKRKKGAADADAGFIEFWNLYPRTPVMSKKEAFREWVKLPAEDKIAATNAIGPYREFLSKNKDHPTVHACRFLSQRRFDGFKPERPRARVLEPFSAEWTMERHKRVESGMSVSFMDAQAEKGNGWSIPIEPQKEAAE